MKKGFYSFSIVMAMALILLMLTFVSNESAQKISSIENNLIKADISNTKRTIMENNVDRIIQAKLKEQIALENFDLILAKTSINMALLNYLKGKAKATNIFFENETTLTLTYLNITSSALLLQTNGRTYAEYTYTSDPTKQSIVSKKIGDKITLYFIIPIDYTQKMIK
jgi:hypothetical protein